MKPSLARAFIACALLVGVGCTRGLEGEPPAPGPAPQPPPFLGVPEDRARKFEDEDPGVASPLRGVTTMTEVQPADYATYTQLKKDGRIAQEEARGGFIYFAVNEHRHLPLSGGGGAAGGAYLTVVNRYKAPIPKGD
jgi:hypothetical protein